MRGLGVPMFVPPRPGRFDRISYWTTLAALAYTAVADAAEPVAAEAGRPIPEPDRDDGDTVPHE